MSRKLWFLDRHNPTLRTSYPPVSGASVDDDPPGDDEEEDDDPPGDGDDKPSKTDESGFTPEQQRHINKMVGKAKAKAKAEAEDEYNRKLEDDRLAAESKFEELYNKSKARVDELEPKTKTLQETVDGLESSIKKYIDPQIDKLPKLTQSLIRKQPILEQIDLLAEHASEMEAEDSEGNTDNGKAKQRPRVPPSNTGRREKKTQPLAAEAVASRQNRVIAGVKQRVGSS